ncbi:MAG: tyrosine-protein phosphatase [Clostridiales bacterium]|nr:tyrosine-protein phosphatase [Clostridiales bacterium]
MEFERLKNTRDLGGLKMKDGRTIRPGMLIRSSHLSIAPARDLAVLRDVVGEIVDFRTLKEQQVHPDPVFEGVPHHPMPVLESMTAGITREEEADRSEIETYLLDPEGARRHMMENYQLFVTSEHARQCYSSFVKLLFAPREKALLWHCTAGKDRAGFATAIVLEILGADLETILEDYMKTNRGLAREIEWIYPMIGKQAGGMTKVMRASLDYMFLAHKEYLLESYKAAGEHYGGMDGYIEKALGIDAVLKTQLQERFLED